MNWLIKILGGYTQAEMTQEKIANLQMQADLIDAHQKESRELSRHVAYLQEQIYKLLIKEPTK